MKSDQIKWRPFEWYVVCKQCEKEYVKGADGPLDAETRGRVDGVRIYNKEITEAFYFCSTKCHEAACEPARGEGKAIIAIHLLFPCKHGKNQLLEMLTKAKGECDKAVKDAFKTMGTAARLGPDWKVSDVDYIKYQGPTKDCGLEIPLTDYRYCRVYDLESGPAIMLSNDPGNWPPLRGIVELADGWAAFCYECGKLLTRGHKDTRRAFFDRGVEAEYCPTGYLKELTRCYCSSTCKTAGEKRRDVMTEEKGKEMWRVVNSNGRSLGADNDYTVSDTQDEAIGKVVSISQATNKFEAWRDKYVRAGFRVESFTPEFKIDWLKVTDDCANQKRWGYDTECAFCNVIRKEDGSIECGICPLNIYAKSKGIGAGVQRCGDLANEQRIRMGLLADFDPWNRIVFLPVLADLRIWLKSGGMKGEK